ncbi:MAG: MarR family winged helix-turn-helix transcriptional regulator [Thermoleophilaceae bacterium]
MDDLYEFALSVKAVERELGRWINEAMRPLGITAAQADALLVIGSAEPVSLKDLGDLLIAEAGHPSRLVDRLVAAGLVAREPAQADRRRVELSLTPSGRRLAKRVERARADVMDLGRQALAGRDLGPVLRLLRELLAATPYGELIARRRELG